MLIVKPAARFLLDDTHVSQDALDRVYVQRHGAVILSHRHQVKHPLCVQMLLVDLQGLNPDIKTRVRALYGKMFPISLFEATR